MATLHVVRRVAQQPRRFTFHALLARSLIYKIFYSKRARNEVDRQFRDSFHAKGAILITLRLSKMI